MKALKTIARVIAMLAIFAVTVAVANALLAIAREMGVLPQPTVTLCAIVALVTGAVVGRLFNGWVARPTR